MGGRNSTELDNIVTSFGISVSRPTFASSVVQVPRDQEMNTIVMVEMSQVSDGTTVAVSESKDMTGK